jgi:hypothetical protein
MTRSIFRGMILLAASFVSLSCGLVKGALAQQPQFDASLFQNPDFITAIYNRTAAPKNQSKAFVWYTYGLVKILNQDRLCRSLLKATAHAAINQAYLKTDPVRETAAAQCLRGQCKTPTGLDNILIVTEQGSRDGDGLVVRVSCQSETGIRIIKNLDAIFAAQP